MSATHEDHDGATLAGERAGSGQDAPASVNGDRRKRSRSGDRKKPRESRRAAMNRTLLAEIRSLQADLAEMVGRYELRVGGRLNEIVTRLEGDPALDQPAQPATIREAQAMLGALRDTRIRARKARPKDLARLEKLSRRLREMKAD